MYLFAVMGNPIAHSLSPEIHHTFAKHLEVSVYYKKILSTERAFSKMVTNFINNGGHGLNITVPFKQQAYVLCAENITERAKVARAVNTLFIKDNALYGDNTDGAGLVNAIKNLGWSLNGTNIAIIGAGGAARGVIMPLAKAGANSITIANRTIQRADDLAKDMSLYTGATQLTASSIEQLTGDYDLIINATSTGLSGEQLQLPVGLSTSHAYDMMYHPRGHQTQFMQHFSALGAQVSDGFGMLINQAAESFEIWTGTRPNVTTIDFNFLRD